MRYKNWVLFFTAVFSLQFVFAQKAAIRGNVSDNISRDGLAGTYISVVSSNVTVVKKAADDKGNFEITGLTPGEYTLTFENVGYVTVIKQYTLKENEILKVYIRLGLQSKALGEVTVLGYRDREKESGSRTAEKNAANVINIISAQAMVRSPDINAANVLQRMSGITVQRSSGGDEAFAVIRGMQPRYNNTLVNGLKIASPDNKNRFVQLDIIPSDILSSIEISKSLTPNMEGDAIGGTVNMVVKDAPEITSFKATASIGYSQIFFDEKYIAFKKNDIQPLSPIGRNPVGYAAQPGDFSRSNLDFQPQQAPPTGTLGFSYTHRFLHNKIGVVLADNVQNQYYGNISSRYTVSPGGANSDSLEATSVSNYKGYTQQLNNGLVAHIDYLFNEKNRINIDNFYVYSYLAQSRLAQDTTLIGTGRVGPGTGQVFNNNESFTQHEYIENLKLSGQHVLSPSFQFDWAGVYSVAGRKLPDLATLTTDFRINPDFTQTATFFDGITRQWLHNEDKDYTGVLNMRWHKKLTRGLFEIKAGGLYRYKSRFNYEDDYELRSSSVNGNGIKPAWTNIYDAQWDVFNSAGTSVYNPNNYTATETVFAEYVMANYKTNKWEVGGGLRVENTNTNWDIKVHSPTAPSSGSQIYQDFLPSVFFKYDITNKQDLHFSYFKSISRPNYYELVPAQTRAPDWYVQGNPSLLHSIADNLDLRYEIFPRGEENLFLGVFYKYIQDPIEQELLSSGGGIYKFSNVNSPPANNYGFELAFTKFWGKFGVTGNYTYTHSSVTTAKLNFQDSLIPETRPLQGQTDHIVNLSLLYKDVKHGFFGQISYEYQGYTLAEISIYHQSNYYQQPTNSLAVSLEKDIHNHFTVFGKFNNLLNTPTTQYIQNSLLASKNIYKANYSIGIRYSH